MSDTKTLTGLIMRLARLEQSDAWRGGLNPAQRAALGYLARANRFSRTPSQVADYLGTTRGTASQTLMALRAKGHVAEEAVVGDRRSISYTVTEAGQAALGHPGGLERALARLDARERAELSTLLGTALSAAVADNRGRPFGICATCAHFRARGPGGFCSLLSQALSADEIGQICHEQVPRAA